VLCWWTALNRIDAGTLEGRRKRPAASPFDLDSPYMGLGQAERRKTRGWALSMFQGHERFVRKTCWRVVGGIEPFAAGRGPQLMQANKAARPAGNTLTFP